MPQMQQSAAGNKFNFAWFLDTDGLPIGNTHTRPAVGSSTNGGPMRFRMPKSVSPTTTPTPTVTLATGEDGIDQHRYQFPADNTQVTAITLAAEDLTQIALIQNKPLVNFAGGQYVGLGENLNPFDVCLLFQSWSIRVSDGAKLWKPLIYPRATLSYAGRDGLNERGVAAFRFDFVSQPVGYEPWGVTVVDANGAVSTEDKITWEGLPYPITLQAFTGSGALQTFPTDYPPVDVNSIAVLLCSPITGVRGATVAAVASVDNSAPGFSFTLTPTPVSGARGIALYQFVV